MRWGVIWAGLAIGALACGDSPAPEPDAAPPPDAGPPDAYAAVCGDSVAELDEQCDDGNDIDDDLCANDCTLNVDATVNATVKWWFNRDDAIGFEGDACTDLDAERVEVELVYIAQPSITYAMTEDCAFRQVTFVGVPEGGYQVLVHPLDAADAMLTDHAVEAWTAFSEQQPIQDVDIGYDDWVRDYTGSFFFRVRWGDAAADCSEVAPPVAQQLLLLEQDGAPVDQLTITGDALDGSAPGPCRPLTDEAPQLAPELPWGPAQLTVVGLDAKGIELYRSTFDTFVGAGLSNPELVFDVVSAP